MEKKLHICPYCQRALPPIFLFSNELFFVKHATN